MRTTLVVVLAAAFAASGAFGAEAPAATPIERLVPANAVALVQVQDVEKLREAFGGSALAEAIAGSPLLSYLHTVAGAAAQFGATLLTGRPAEEVRACLGQHAGAVLLDFQNAQDVKARVPIAILVEVADAAKLQAILGAQLQLLALVAQEVAVAERQHAGATVRDITGPQGTLSWCVRGNMLILGTRDGVSSLLDSLAADAPRIASDATYRAVCQSLPTTAGVRAYVNLDALKARSGINANPAQLQKLRAVGLANASAAGLAIDFAGRQVRERLYLHTGGNNTGLVRLLTQGQPITPTTTRFVPASYTVVASLALRDVGLWERVRTMLIDARGDMAGDFIDGAAAQVQQHFGVQIREGLLDTFTDEVLFAVDLSRLSSFHGAGREPRPQELPFLFAARVRDPVALVNTFDRVAANERLWEQGIERTVARHAETDVFTFRIPMNPDARPSYALVGDVFLFSLRPEHVGLAIDANTSKKSMAAPAGATAPAPLHLRIQANDARLLAALLGCIRNEAPAGLQRILPEVDRLLAGLHGYEATVRREPQGVSLLAQSDLGTIGTVLMAAVLIDQSHPIVARRIESDFDQIAAALEKYHAKHNSYPEKLEHLVPDFLPHLVHDRFQPKRAYGYSRGHPDAAGKYPDAWALTSVGPDKRPDIPLEQFDPVEWPARLRAQDPETIGQLKRVLYRFRTDQFKDERKNDDEGDLCRIGGKGLGAQPAQTNTAPVPKPPKTPPAAQGAPKP